MFVLTAQSELGERMGHIAVQLVGDHTLVHSLIVFLHGIHVQRVRGRCGRAGLPGHSVFQPGHHLLQNAKMKRVNDYNIIILLRRCIISKYAQHNHYQTNLTVKISVKKIFDLLIKKKYLNCTETSIYSIITICCTIIHYIQQFNSVA